MDERLIDHTLFDSHIVKGSQPLEYKMPILGPMPFKLMESDCPRSRGDCRGLDDFRAAFH
jgi:hypothetical protein